MWKKASWLPARISKCISVSQILRLAIRCLGLVQLLKVGHECSQDNLKDEERFCADELPSWLPCHEGTLIWVNTIIKEYEAGSATMSVQGCPVGLAPHLKKFFVRGKTRAISKRILKNWQGRPSKDR